MEHVRRNAFGLATMALLLATGLSVGAAQGYLRCVGPTPLRFAPTPPNPAAFPWPPLFPHVETATNSVDYGAQAEQATNTFASLPGEPSPTNSAPVVVELPGPSGEPGTPLEPNSVSSPAPASQLLVTPQMLLEYLRPALGGPVTNGVPFEQVPFLPPAPCVHPSSEASYRTE